VFKIVYCYKLRILISEQMRCDTEDVTRDTWNVFFFIPYFRQMILCEHWIFNFITLRGPCCSSSGWRLASQRRDTDLVSCHLKFSSWISFSIADRHSAIAPNSPVTAPRGAPWTSPGSTSRSLGWSRSEGNVATM
jgi:hypothetical protein